MSSRPLSKVNYFTKAPPSWLEGKFVAVYFKKLGLSMCFTGVYRGVNWDDELVLETVEHLTCDPEDVPRFDFEEIPMDEVEIVVLLKQPDELRGNSPQAQLPDVPQDRGTACQRGHLGGKRQGQCCVGTCPRRTDTGRCSRVTGSCTRMQSSNDSDEHRGKRASPSTSTGRAPRKIPFIQVDDLVSFSTLTGRARRGPPFVRGNLASPSTSTGRARQGPPGIQSDLASPSTSTGQARQGPPGFQSDLASPSTSTGQAPQGPPFIPSDLSSPSTSTGRAPRGPPFIPSDLSSPSTPMERAQKRKQWQNYKRGGSRGNPKTGS